MDITTRDMLRGWQTATTLINNRSRRSYTGVWSSYDNGSSVTASRTRSRLSGLRNFDTWTDELDDIMWNYTIDINGFVHMTCKENEETEDDINDDSAALDDFLSNFAVKKEGEA